MQTALMHNYSVPIKNVFAALVNAPSRLAVCAQVGSGVWRSEPDGMYFNMGFIPNGLEPRVGSLTLVDAGSGFSSMVAREGK